MRTRWLAILAALMVALMVALTGSGATPSESPDLVVHVESGFVRGHTTADSRSFEGIPYAAPPVGALRWQAPQPAPGWPGVRDATVPGNQCAQGRGGTATIGSEDCLYLDVTTPREATAGSRLPVLVWLHGGARGGGSDYYDAHRLAEQGDLVVVTVNYRQGIFGDFGYPGLAGSGTFDLEDQQAALRWVRGNIAAFGGDAHNTTLAGESGGALSICAQLTSPSAAGLFDKAVIQSGPCLMDYARNAFGPGSPEYQPWVPVGQVTTTGADVAKSLGCTGTAQPLQCLRGKDTATILTKNDAFGLSAYGTDLLPLTPQRALRAGAVHRVPVLIGTNSDEDSVAAALFTGPFDTARYTALLTDTFGAAATGIAQQYPQPPYPSPMAAWTAINTDRVFSCPALASAQLLATTGPVYQYEFADRTAPNPGDATRADQPLGATHGAELGYLFDWKGITAKLTEPQRQLAATMIRYWSQFARTGNPNITALPDWSATRPGEPQSPVLSLAPGAGGIHPVDLYSAHHCDLWPQS